MTTINARKTKIFLIFSLIVTLLAILCANPSASASTPADVPTASPIEVVEPEVTESPVEETLPPEPFTIWKDGIYYESGIVEPSDVMAYTYLKPMTDNSEPKPLIVWLHGGGRKGLQTFYESNYNLTHIVADSELSHFDAYVISPVLYGDFYNEFWCKDVSADYLRAVIDKFCSENNVDTESIVVCGGSMGGQGTVYMAANMDNYFCKAYIMSGYHVYDIHADDFKMPVKGYVGKWDDEKSINYMKGLFREVGEENLTILESAKHSGVPKKAYNLDADGNGRSDLIEDMFG